MRRALVLAALLAAACKPVTDREVYAPGESGTATFRNGLAAATLYLGGCGHFAYEQRVASEWVSRGSDLTCVWEGFAEPVAPGEEVVDPITARDPGRWRLRYAVGLGCSESEPLSACERVESIASNEFDVVERGCVVTGCSSHVCAEEPVATTCEYLPHYACYQGARCGRYGPNGACAWQPTEELTRCLEANGAEPSAR